MCCCQKTPTHSFRWPFFFFLNNGGQGQVPCPSVIGAGIGGVKFAKAWELSQAQIPSIPRINAHQWEQSLSQDLKGDTSLLTRLLKTSPDQYKHLFIPISSKCLKAWRQSCKSGHSHLGKWGQRGGKVAVRVLRDPSLKCQRVFHTAMGPGFGSSSVLQLVFLTVLVVTNTVSIPRYGSLTYQRLFHTAMGPGFSLNSVCCS